MLEGRIEILDQRSLGFPHQDCEDVRCMTGRRYGWMIAGREGECVSMPREMCCGIATSRIPELRAEPGWWVEAPVIDLLVCGFSRLISIVLVRRVTGPTTLICVKLTDKQVAGATCTVLSQDMKNATARFRLIRADFDDIDLLRSDSERSHRLSPRTSGDSDLAITSSNDRDISTRSGIHGISFTGPNISASPEICELAAV